MLDVELFSDTRGSTQVFIVYYNNIKKLQKIIIQIYRKKNHMLKFKED